MYNIHLLPASFGDAILIEYGKTDEPHYILIDGGPYYAFEEIMDAIKSIAPNLSTLELLVVTHIDIDHIDGIVKFLNQKPIPFKVKDIWFNGWNQLPEDDILGPIQGEYLSTLLASKRLPHNKMFEGKPVMIEKDRVTRVKLKGGMLLTLLSPDQMALSKLRKEWEKTLTKAGLSVDDKEAFLERLEDDTRYEDEEDDLLGDLDIESLAKATPPADKSAANGSSIAFIAEFENKRCLFAADTPSADIKKALEDYNLLDNEQKLRVDAWKLAHHGSRKSTHDFLMKMIDCKRFLISSDGKRYHHPDPEIPAKLITQNGPDLEFYFNYNSQYSSVWGEKNLEKKYSYKTFFPGSAKNGISLNL
ncbi:MAG: MBL fold metallo-hydrolase [Eudoraea sp.]|nr:MBL fold metallo-hydrolase [Eudoraea sp.]